MKKAFGIITTSLLVIVIIFAIMLAGVRLVGITPYTVLSGSMEKEIHVGALIYTVKADPSTLKEQDIITYVIEGGTVVTHRIIELVPDEEDPTLVRFRTKGDNNKTADGDPVHPNNILGKVIFDIPLLGYIAWFVQNPPGCYITIGVGIILILLTFLPELLDKLDETEEKKKSSTAGGVQISDSSELDGQAPDRSSESEAEEQQQEEGEPPEPKEHQDSAPPNENSEGTV